MDRTSSFLPGGNMMRWAEDSHIMPSRGERDRYRYRYSSWGRMCNGRGRFGGDSSGGTRPGGQA